MTKVITIATINGKTTEAKFDFIYRPEAEIEAMTMFNVLTYQMGLADVVIVKVLDEENKTVLLLNRGI